MAGLKRARRDWIERIISKQRENRLRELRQEDGKSSVPLMGPQIKGIPSFQSGEATRQVV
jgi:hypothetical protein